MPWNNNIIMYTNKHLGLLVLIILVACTSSVDRRGPGSGADSSDRSVDDIYLHRFALEDFQKRLEAALTHFDNNNGFLFRGTKDSLMVDVNAYIRHHPRSEQDPEFVRILNQLYALDTLKTGNGEAFTSAEDSLALAFADWPELDVELDDGQMFDAFNSVFPTLENRHIDFWINYFTGPGKERFERSVYRMQLYRPIVGDILAEMELPPELICVALIESGFSMKAVSRAKAVGPWQFIRGTAKLYGLRNNWWYDERQDIVAATYAAGNYLKDLYSLWNDWFLALAAYNCGEYRVARAVASARSTNFWHLRLPKQTERYVPKFLAALYILRDPEKYDIKIPDVEPVEFDHVSISDATDLSVIARCADTTVKTLKDLNPACLRWTTPPNTEIHVKVPAGSGERCQANLTTIPASERVTWRQHKVRKGETLSMIASKYGTTVSSLKNLNGIRNSHMIREGTSLVVPLKGDFAETVSSKPQYKSSSRKINKEALENYAQRSAPPSGYKQLIYTVKDKDTLGEIAEIFKTSASRIRSWNELHYSRYIYPGQNLVIYVPESFTPSEQATTSTPDVTLFFKKAHVVKKGETFYSISRSYNVALNDLLAWNNKSHRSIIRPGDVIDIWQKK